mmetsp:Transcript_17573/g.32232  ORF Transcript_17573/g.32232 Transcript_17573/m.32232 type:complete len:208 (-) Transcript_17573:393-1016(-)
MTTKQVITTTITIMYFHIKIVIITATTVSIIVTTATTTIVVIIIVVVINIINSINDIFIGHVSRFNKIVFNVPCLVVYRKRCLVVCRSVTFAALSRFTHNCRRRTSRSGVRGSPALKAATVARPPVVVLGSRKPAGRGLAPEDFGLNSCTSASTNIATSDFISEICVTLAFAAPFAFSFPSGGYISPPHTEMIDAPAASFARASPTV